MKRALVSLASKNSSCGEWRVESALAPVEAERSHARSSVALGSHVHLASTTRIYPLLWSPYSCEKFPQAASGSLIRPFSLFIPRLHLAASSDSIRDGIGGVVHDQMVKLRPPYLRSSWYGVRNSAPASRHTQLPPPCPELCFFQGVPGGQNAPHMPPYQGYPHPPAGAAGAAGGAGGAFKGMGGGYLGPFSGMAPNAPPGTAPTHQVTCCVAVAVFGVVVLCAVASGGNRGGDGYFFVDCIFVRCVVGGVSVRATPCWCLLCPSIHTHTCTYPHSDDVNAQNRKRLPVVVRSPSPPFVPNHADPRDPRVGQMRNHVHRFLVPSCSLAPQP